MKILQYLVGLYKFTRVDSSLKPQTHLSAEILIVRLIERVIVLYHRKTVLEISHQFLGQKISEKYLSKYITCSFSHRLSNEYLNCRVVQIHDAAFVSVRAAR